MDKFDEEEDEGKDPRYKTGPFPVMPEMCKSCIFRTDGNAVVLASGRLDQIREYLIQGTAHICHTPQLAGEEHLFACRGGRQFQLQVWHRMGIIAEATDEALAEAMTAMGFEAPQVRGHKLPRNASSSDSPISGKNSNSAS